MAILEVFNGLVFVEFLVEDPVCFVDSWKALQKQKTAKVISYCDVFGTLLDKLSQEGKRIGVDYLIEETIRLPLHYLHQLARLRLLS